MTKLLAKAIERVQVLDEATQDEIAALILEELEDEARWDKTFADTQEGLGKLAEEALAEFRTGKTVDMRS